MGLFSWIKDKYNESRLNKADRFVQEKRFSEAEEIYRKLFYDHLLAVPHLANMFVSSSNSVDERISALKKIVELGSFANDGNRHLYDTELKAHIRNMESQASTLFHNKQYKQAVSLIDSLISLRGSDAAFMNRVHQYHAYLSFSIIAQTARYQEHLDDTIKELKAYAPSCKSDIKYFVDNLTAGSYYYRAIKLLQPFFRHKFLMLFRLNNHSKDLQEMNVHEVRFYAYKYSAILLSTLLINLFFKCFFYKETTAYRRYFIKG